MDWLKDLIEAITTYFEALLEWFQDGAEVVFGGEWLNSLGEWAKGFVQ